MGGKRIAEVRRWAAVGGDVSAILTNFFHPSALSPFHFANLRLRLASPRGELFGPIDFGFFHCVQCRAYQQRTRVLESFKM